MNRLNKIRVAAVLTVLSAIGYWALLQHIVSQDKTDGTVTGSVSKVRLLEWYTEANAWYFDDQLPHDTEIVWVSLRYKKAMGDSECNTNGCLIRLDPFVNVAPATVHETELHEICHIATWGQDIDVHGPPFQACIKMLFDKGAFVGLI
jgi:hypothetical protein